MSPNEHAGNVVRLDSANQNLRLSFLKWQCHIRQIAMRQGGGKPSDGMLPALRLSEDGEPVGHIISVMNKAWEHSVTMEIRHLARRTLDPQARRESLNIADSVKLDDPTIKEGTERFCFT